ncbi:MAG TPA: hypothetical protein VKU42_04210 [Candidatus Angelobacter sp.]|nr:hypothetical protein [Candidatus Angelobacter sp.]
MMNRLDPLKGRSLKGSPVKRLLLFAMMLFSGAAFAQAIPWLDDPPPANTQLQATNTLAPDTMAPQVATTTAPSTVTIPAGTRVLMVLKSPLHTTSGTAGSGLYLETLYPVIQDNRVVIPAHTYVQGVVETEERPGHVKRTAEFQFRFTTLIFSNNFVAPINGVLQSIPGAGNIRAHDKDGTLETVDQTEKVVTPAVIGAVSGATIGSNHNFGIGKFTGAGLGAALGLGSVLLKRGDAINLVPGTHIEMVLQAPLNLEQAQITQNVRNTSPQSSFPELKDPAAADERNDQKRNPFNGRRMPGLLGLLQPVD